MLALASAIYGWLLLGSACRPGGSRGGRWAALDPWARLSFSFAFRWAGLSAPAGTGGALEPELKRAATVVRRYSLPVLHHESRPACADCNMILGSFSTLK